MADLSKLNTQQRDSIEQSINNTVVLLAAAGSGKTTVLVKRTEYLIDDLKVDPQNIMMITFTNKAANEIRERVAKVSQNAYKMWIGTFHRICTKILRMFGSRMGIQNFTIIDQKDAKALIKSIIEQTKPDVSSYYISHVQSKISSYKNNLIGPSRILIDSNEDRYIASVYQEYQNICWQKKSFDFDDLIIYTIHLLSSYKDVLDWVHGMFKYIMVDETQDTNSAQFVLIKLLCGANNIMCVGDVNQSIYAFRDANPEYLENFANSHPNTIKLKLEKNYRSTKNIINAANAMIANNKFGTKINMFCDNEDGTKIQNLKILDPYAEAKWIASEILCSGKNYEDFAIIYRTNTQSRIIEDILTASGIQYTVFGSQSFYSRKEVKDLIAFCKFIINDTDINAFKRVLSTIRGVGKVTSEAIIKIANDNNTHNAISNYIATNTVNQTVIYRLNVLDKICNTKYNKCSDMISDILTLTDYRTNIASVQSEETTEKLAIIDEFVEAIKSMEANNPNDTIEMIIDQVALLSDAKGAEKAELNAVKLMTAHASKGLEFDTVFIVGAEEGMFPHANAINENTLNAIEEERRLFYVAMTRAKKNLYITHCMQRKMGSEGSLNTCSESRFIEEIPKDLIEEAF